MHARAASRADAAQTLIPIGRGTYATVYYDSTRNVAVKVQRCGDQARGIQGSVLREARILGKLHHARIASLLDVKLDAEFVYFCLEYLPRSLRQVIQGQESGAVTARTVARELFEALTFCHANGVMHRDVTPDNVMLTERGHVKLSDFGLAREWFDASSRREERTLTLPVVTLWYRPPEVLRGTRYDQAIDVWSAGCVVAELCLGCPAFPGTTELEVADMTARELSGRCVARDVARVDAVLGAAVGMCLRDQFCRASSAAVQLYVERASNGERVECVCAP